MPPLSFRDTLIVSLLTSNTRRAAWPISSVLPLLTRLGMPITYREFIGIIIDSDCIDDSSWHDASKLGDEMFRFDAEREIVTRWKHYTEGQADPRQE